MIKASRIRSFVFPLRWYPNPKEPHNISILIFSHRISVRLVCLLFSVEGNTGDVFLCVKGMIIDDRLTKPVEVEGARSLNQVGQFGAFGGRGDS